MLEVKDDILKGTKPKVVSEAFIEVRKGIDAFSVSCKKAKGRVRLSRCFKAL